MFLLKRKYKITKDSIIVIISINKMQDIYLNKYINDN